MQIGVISQQFRDRILNVNVLDTNKKNAGTEIKEFIRIQLLRLTKRGKDHILILLLMKKIKLLLDTRADVSLQSTNVAHNSNA